MSPEQANIDGRRATRQSDVYALGVMLYEMLSGRGARRLDGMTVLGAVRTVRESESLRLGSGASGLGGRLQKIVARATAVVPDDRYATVAELSDELETYLEDVARADEKVAWRTRTVAAAVTLLVMSSWIGGYSVSESKSDGLAKKATNREAPRFVESVPADDVARVQRTAVAERAQVVEELVSRCGTAAAAAIRGDCFLEVALGEPKEGTEPIGREEFEGWVRGAAVFFVKARVLLVAEPWVDRTRARLFDLRIALCQAALGDVKPARQTYWAVLAETRHDFDLADALGITLERLRKALHLPAPAPVLPATLASPFNPTSPGSPSRGSMNGGGASSGQ